ncbi:MAG: DUF934 domain-containing protein [Candidatus Puniceispirillales bacterium]
MTAETALVHITREGFAPDPWQHRIVLTIDTLDQRTDPDNSVLRLDGDARVEEIAKELGQFNAISLTFPGFQDGRGFSLARKLRAMGYRGMLRAEGGIHVDQFRHALLAGFDAVAIPEDQAARMPERLWRQAVAEALPSYQAMFMAHQDRPFLG